MYQAKIFYEVKILHEKYRFFARVPHFQQHFQLMFYSTALVIRAFKRLIQLEVCNTRSILS